MESDCDACAGPIGHYRMQCVDCCARLVMSTKPSKALAGSMLAAVDRRPGRPTREQILARVAEMKEGVGEKDC